MSPQSAISAISPARVHAAREGIGLGELVPHLRGLLIDQVSCAAASVELEARSCLAGAACRACGAWPSRVHSGYVRRVQDGPLGGRPVLIRRAVRRFFCGNPACPMATFAEQVEGLTARYRRRSLPLLGLLARSGWRWRAGPGPGWRPCWASPCTGPRCWAWSPPCPNLRSAPRRR